ncbi:SDR family NAD(P)-dependent oxidoreductase [Natronobiforma cellulositropha]|uniref:SDR family NAD(P)-dependent oxidoreductase n=1 Tax=Natronobiforma cellulositropha TaxID=1679076 RepID=UPI0021D60E15|nr:SDR family NAD(P)-dependent oxidoreductase [Natronobiforma cellulositropha]
MFELDGKTAWVTGSTQNLGREMIEDFAELGADVVISNRRDRSVLDQAVDEVEAEYGVDAYGVQLDVSDEDSVIDAVNEINREFSAPDILVNNVGIRPHEDYDEITLEDWNRVIATNLTGGYLCSKYVLPEMIDNEWGRLMFISGVDAYFGTTGRIHCVSTKAGLFGLTRAFASKVGQHNITSNCLVPGVFDTDRNLENYPGLEDRYKVWRGRAPLGRLGQPEEFSPAAAFLATDEASFITGQVIHVNGGLFPTVQGPSHFDLDSEAF